MNILVTGFDPFGEIRQNPSASAASQLGELEGITPLILPTSYERSIAMLDNALDAEKFTAIILLGFAKNVDGLRIEKYGRNETTATKPDNDDIVLSGGIDESGPPVIETKIDTDRLAQIASAHCPVKISENAGGYVCNYTYYHVLKNHPELPALFIHLTHGKESERFPVIIDAIRDIVSAKVLS